MHYVGQGYDVSVSIPNRDFSLFSKDEIQALFDRQYSFLYGNVYSDVKIEFMNLRLNAELPRPPLKMQKLPARGDVSMAIKGRREAYDGESSSYIEHTVYDRYKLFSGAMFQGPAILEEKETTVVVGSEAKVSVDEFGTISIILD